MSHTPHELAAEFPDFVEKMHEMKASNAHFTKLSDEYHEVNRSVHRAETNVEPTDDVHMADLRKQRLALKDEIWGLLNA